MTLRVRVLKAQAKQESATRPSDIIDIFKVECSDICKKGYLLLKHNKSKQVDLLVSEEYIVDRIKLIINKKGEVVLISTSLTGKYYFRTKFSPIAFRAESDDTFEVDSLELN